jgi:thiol peroxidase
MLPHFLLNDFKNIKMAQTKLKDVIVNTNSDLPKVGSGAVPFTLIAIDLREVKLSDFAGKNVVLNIFPSIDTSTCATSVREFNKRAAVLTNTVVLCISKDLPFAYRRFCGAEGIDKVISLSDYRNEGFSKNYGVELIDGNFKGLDARAIVVINEEGKVVHTELVPSISNEPNYDEAIKALA